MNVTDTNSEEILTQLVIDMTNMLREELLHAVRKGRVLNEEQLRVKFCEISAEIVVSE